MPNKQTIKLRGGRLDGYRVDVDTSTNELDLCVGLGFAGESLDSVSRALRQAQPSGRFAVAHRFTTVASALQIERYQREGRHFRHVGSAKVRSAKSPSGWMLELDPTAEV